MLLTKILPVWEFCGHCFPEDSLWEGCYQSRTKSEWEFHPFCTPTHSRSKQMQPWKQAKMVMAFDSQLCGQVSFLPFCSWSGSCFFPYNFLIISLLISAGIPDGSFFPASRSVTSLRLSLCFLKVSVISYVLFSRCVMLENHGIHSDVS